MKIVNENKKDLSDEMLIHTAVMFAFIEGAQRMCYKVTDMLDQAGYDVNLYHNNKRNFKMAQDMSKKLTFFLNNAFDDAFDRIYRGSAERCDDLGWLCLDLIRAALIYTSRREKDIENAQKIKEMMMELEGVDIDLEGLLDLYKMRF